MHKDSRDTKLARHIESQGRARERQAGEAGRPAHAQGSTAQSGASQSVGGPGGGAPVAGEPRDAATPTAHPSAAGAVVGSSTDAPAAGSAPDTRMALSPQGIGAGSARAHIRGRG